LYFLNLVFDAHSSYIDMAALLTPLLWSFLPPQITHAILPTLSSSLPHLLPPALRGSPGYARNYRLVSTAVVVIWLGWTIASPLERAPASDTNWYDLLDVGRGADEDGLKKAFRTL
jgi:hypothetical protein